MKIIYILYSSYTLLEWESPCLILTAIYIIQQELLLIIIITSNDKWQAKNILFAFYFLALCKTDPLQAKGDREAIKDQITDSLEQ